LYKLITHFDIQENFLPDLLPKVFFSIFCAVKASMSANSKLLSSYERQVGRPNKV